MLKNRINTKMVAFSGICIVLFDRGGLHCSRKQFVSLVKMYGIALDKVVLLGSANALGRCIYCIFYRKNGGKVWTNKSTGSRNRADWSILNRNTHCACILSVLAFAFLGGNWNGNSRYSVPGIINYGIS